MGIMTEPGTGAGAWDRGKSKGRGRNEGRGQGREQGKNRGQQEQGNGKRDGNGDENEAQQSGVPRRDPNNGVRIKYHSILTV